MFSLPSLAHRPDPEGFVLVDGEDSEGFRMHNDEIAGHEGRDAARRGWILEESSAIRLGALATSRCVIGATSTHHNPH